MSRRGSRRRRARALSLLRERDLIVVAAAVDQHELAQAALLAEFPGSDAPLTLGHVPQRLLADHDESEGDGE
jgi:hypothetical protein